MASVTFDASLPRHIKIRWNDFEHGFVINGQNLGRHGRAIATYFFRFSASWISRDAQTSGQHRRLLIGSLTDSAALSYEISKDKQHPGCSIIIGEFSVTDIDHTIIDPEMTLGIAPEHRYGKIAEDFNAPFLLGHWIVNFPQEAQMHTALSAHQRILPIAC